MFGGILPKKSGKMSGVECKEIMTKEIFKETDKVFDEDIKKIKQKNDALLYSLPQDNFKSCLEVVNSIQQSALKLVDNLNKSKLDATFKKSGNDIKAKCDPLFTQINKQIYEKSFSLQINKYVKTNQVNIEAMQVSISKNIEIFNKLGCCDCFKKGDVKDLIKVALLRFQNVAIPFIECFANLEGLPSKQEFKPSGIDVNKFKRNVQEFIDQYFPTDKEITTVEIVKEIIKEVPKEIIKEKERIVYRDKQPQEDYMCIAHELVYGIGGPQQVKKGMEFYEEEESKSNVKALNCLGQLYFEGKLVKQNYEKSYEYYLRSSQNNDPEGLYRVGIFYERGLVEQDRIQSMPEKERIKKAIEYYKKASDKNHQGALTDLGFIYENGLKNQSSDIIVQQNLSTAESLYSNVDIDNCPRACNNLGTLSLKFNKKADAVNYFKKANKMLLPSGAMNLGICYLKGIGVVKDGRKAMKYLKKAAEQGNTEAKLQYSYQLLQQACNSDNEQEFFIAATYLREILIKEPNNSDALNYLGFLHEFGFGVALDIKTAYTYYERAAALNNDKALTKLGDIYFTGTYGEPNIQKAIQYYEKAATLGNTVALVNLGSVYEKGYNGEAPNYKKAYGYYLDAAEKGSGEAWMHIGLMKEEGKIENSDPAGAYENYMLAAQRGSINSLYVLKDRVNLMMSDNHQYQTEEDAAKLQFLQENQGLILKTFRDLGANYNFNNKIFLPVDSSNYLKGNY